LDKRESTQLHWLNRKSELSDPKDRVAIYGLSETLHVLCDFTSDRDRLLAILKNYDTTGSQAWNDPEGSRGLSSSEKCRL
jgi:hypothetical protein